MIMQDCSKRILSMNYYTAAEVSYSTLVALLRNALQLSIGLAKGQQWCGVKLPSILTVAERSTTTSDHPSPDGFIHPSEADKKRDQRTRTTY
jgi:hypothetical protein